jgi:hypothetical protein
MSTDAGADCAQGEVLKVNIDVPAGHEAVQLELG